MTTDGTRDDRQHVPGGGAHLGGPGTGPGDCDRLAQARDNGTFTSTHDAFWAAARRAHGDAGGTRALIEVLLLYRHLPHSAVIAGIDAALQLGTVTADIVAVEARKHSHRQPHRDIRPAAPANRSARVISLTERRLADPGAVIGGLPVDERPLPSVAHYDELLTLHASRGAAPAPGRVS